jgi:putative transposase
MTGASTPRTVARIARSARAEIAYGIVAALARPMTAPRQILAGATYLVTRRCSQRLFLLKPSRLTNSVFLYLLAVAARRFGIAVHAYCVLSNHFHLVLTDPAARLPAFHQFLDALLGRAINASLGRCEAFWAPNSYSAVALASPSDVVDKTAYLLANPAAAGLVRFGRLWPGLWSDPQSFGGRPITARRPKHFFDPNGSLPAEATLELTMPPGFASADEFRALVSAALAEREAQAARDFRRGFLGVAAVLAQKPTRRPAPGESRRTLNPRIAARDRWKRIETLGRLTRFLSAYRKALAAYLAGEKSVPFPAGTYLLRVLHGVPCAGVG